MSDQKIITEVVGFKFIKVGEFKFSEKPHKFKTWVSELSVNLYDERYEKADETVYLMIDEKEEILYVGEFTYNLNDRGLCKKYVDHHQYENIESALKEKKDISLWLAISPYCAIKGCGELNISKSIEQQIVIVHQPKWNKRGKQLGSEDFQGWRDKNCIRLDSFLS